MMKKIKLIVIATLMLLSTWIKAQPQGPHPKMKNPEEIARCQADMMKSEIGITDKQYKKVYKLIKKDMEYRNSQTNKQFGGSTPPQGGAPGEMGGRSMPPQNGGTPGNMGGGGMPPQGGGMNGGAPGNRQFGGGMPPRGGKQGEKSPEGGPMMDPGYDLISDEYLDKQETKLKKILTIEQYSKWRSKHLDERHQLPPMGVK